jgi:hypothetical protein
LGSWNPSESIRIRLYRIRPNPEPISVGSKCPYRLYNTANKSPAWLLGIRPNPSESDPPPNPSESRTAFPALFHYLAHDNLSRLGHSTKPTHTSYRCSRRVEKWTTVSQSDKMSHIDMADDHIDTVISHIISPHPISISRMTISIWLYIDMVDNHIDITHPISITHIPYRHPYRYLIDVRSPLSISNIDLPYRSPISMSRSYLVTLCVRPPKKDPVMKKRLRKVRRCRLTLSNPR